MSEKEKLLRRIALSSLKNAEQYVKDAEVLLKKKVEVMLLLWLFACAKLREEESN